MRAIVSRQGKSGSATTGLNKSQSRRELLASSIPGRDNQPVMLSILGTPGRLCDRPSRRELLSVGGLSLLGFGLPELLSRQARTADGQVQATNSATGFGK